MTEQTTGYCPHCGRGDVAPTAEAYEQQRQLAERAEAALAEARGQIERVRKVIAERQTEVSEREAGGMLPFGTPGASWCDAVTVTCARVEDALRIFPPAVGIPCLPDYNAGPSVAECAEGDRAHWTAKYDR